MTLGIECLLTDDAARADELARTLDGINRERRDIEGGMRDQALVLAESLFAGAGSRAAGHQRVRCRLPRRRGRHRGLALKDRFHRPAFVFAASGAPGREHELKGSGRSIAGFHLRDALDLVAKRHPGVLLRFGGHAMAAGCTVAREHFGTFERALAEVAREWLAPAALLRQIDTDGALAPEYLRVDLVDTLHREVWGQGFAPPTFSEEVEVVSQRLVGEKHLALKLRQPRASRSTASGSATPSRCLRACCSPSVSMPTNGKACGACAFWSRARKSRSPPRSRTSTAPRGPGYRQSKA